MIKGSTRVLAVIGDPIEHSLSPVMHNAALDYLGLDCVYVAFRVPPPNLRTAVETAKAFLGGLNVTIPHKIRIMSLLDEVDELAWEIGAVNTVKIENGEAIGYNTDGIGAVKAIGDVKDERILILGAGGAARAIAFSLSSLVKKITIANRTFKKGKELAMVLREKVESKAIELRKDVLTREISYSDILINATSVGMYPRSDETLVTSEMMHEGLIVKDIVYNPIETRLLSEARKANAKTISGLEMFVNQGAEAFKIFLGVDPPIEVMKEAVEKELR